MADQLSTAEALASFAESLRCEDVPKAVREKAKLHLLDTLGVMVSASRMEYAAAVHGVALEMGGREEATTVGFGSHMPAAWAAMVNGSLAHGQDYDDTHTESVTHVSASVVAATLAMAERQGASGAEALAAAIVGYEVTTRIGAAAPNAFNARGYHATGVCGAFGVAAIAGKLLGLDAGRLTRALGIAGSQASGIEEFLRDGTSVKRLHPGWAAHAGIIAALLAQRDFTGPATVLEGTHGFFHSHLDPAPFDAARVTRGLGKEWAVSETSLKLYPACHHVHGSVDAALELRRRHDVRPEEVSDVLCYIPAAGVAVVAEPVAEKLFPVNSYGACFSLQYCVAAALVLGHALPPAFAESNIRDPRILELAGKVRYTVDPEALFPVAYGGGVDLVLKDGRRYNLRVPACKGSPQNPASREEIAAKFLANTRETLAPGASNRLLEAVLRLEELPSVAPMADLVRARA